MPAPSDLPVAIVGAGPVGLAAAAELIERGVRVKVYEAGATVGANIREWGHVRLFSPWRYNIADAAVRFLAAHGWTPQAPDQLPTGRDLYGRYIRPLGALPQLAGVIETASRITAIARLGMDKVVSKDRATKPFVLSVESERGSRRELARAIIDASGTWTLPNPLGADGLLAEGERELAGFIDYGIPDVLGNARGIYSGKRALVVGSRHSAANVILDLEHLKKTAPRTEIVWATRSADLARVFGGGAADGLPARGELGAGLKVLVDRGRVERIAGFATASLRRASGSQIMIDGETALGRRTIGPFDRIVVATGQRPDLSLTRELRLDLDPWLESAKALGPLIDPNVHSCGSVPPHGHRELAHPEAGFYTIGIKSYGRAPTFLLLTGYEQARSVAAAIAGDIEAADDVRLVLPETGVCSVPVQSELAAGCCGGPAPAETDACCVADATAKASGKTGCGCREAA